MKINIDMAGKDSDKTIYSMRVAGTWIEISKPLYESFEADRRKYLEMLNSLPRWTEIFETTAHENK